MESPFKARQVKCIVMVCNAVYCYYLCRLCKVKAHEAFGFN